jgi:hypothetical protein
VHLPTAVLAAAGLLCGALSGCTVNGGGLNVPTVSRTALQQDIAQRLADAGEKPESVTCRQDLVGDVGTTAHCEVVVSASNSFEPIVTVTAVDGAAIDYEMAPAVSPRQLEDVVARLVADSGGPQVKVVSCESGLQGTIGAVAHCDLDADGVWTPHTVTVSGVRGLMMTFELLPPPA